MLARHPKGTIAFILAVSVAVAGCSAYDNFRLQRRIQVDDASRGAAVDGVAIQGVAGHGLTGHATLDLSASGDAWVNRRSLHGVIIRSVLASIASVDGDNLATRSSGTLALRPDGAPADGSQDVVLGRFTDLPLKAGAPIEVTLSKEAGDVVRSALEGSGRLALVMNGRADSSQVGFAVDVALDVGVKYAPLRRL